MKIVKSILLSTIILSANDNIIERTLHLSIDNQKFTIPTSKESIVKIDGKEHKVKVTIDSLATFNHPNLKFKFPSNLNFGADESSKDKGLINWNLNGHNVTIMIMEFNKKHPKEIILNGILQKYKLMHAKIEKKYIEIVLKNGQKIKGDSINVTLGDINMVQDIFIFYKDNNTYVLVFQDLPNRSKNHTKEYIDILNIIRNSLDIKGLTQK